MAVDLARLCGHIDAMHPNLARQRLLQPGQAAQQGGFACAIGADQRGDAAACNVQANAIQGPMAGVFKDQIRDVDHTVLQRSGTAICGRIAAFCPLWPGCLLQELDHDRRHPRKF